MEYGVIMKRKHAGIASMGTLLLCASALAAQTPDVSGLWRRNGAMSESATGEIERVMGRPVLSGTGGGSHIIFNRDAILDNMDRVALYRALVDYASRLDRVEIALTDRELEVTLARDYVGIFYLDGDEHVRELPSGARLEAACTVKGDSIQVEQKGEGATLVETYTLGSTDRLTVELHLRSSLLDEPIAFRTVYDRVEDES
jgi:hypothetical protein